MNTFRDVGEEALFFRRQQITKYTHVYSISLQVKMPLVSGQVVNVEPVLQIMEDADFHITHMTGSVTDPANLDGSRYRDNGSDLALLFPMVGNPNRGSRGIWFKFEDPKANRPLQHAIRTNNAVVKAAQYLSPYDQSMVEFGSVFSPGYGYDYGKPTRFDYTLMRSERLKILIQNRQFMGAPVTGTACSRVSIAFIGHRYET